MRWSPDRFQAKWSPVGRPESGLNVDSRAPYPEPTVHGRLGFALAPPMAAFLASVVTAACAASEPNPYPASAQAEYNRTCPAEDAVCACTWDKITRAMTYEQYDAAVERFRVEGLMDPAITRARGACLGKG